VNQQRLQESSNSKQFLLFFWVFFIKKGASQSCANYQPRKLTKDATPRFSSEFLIFLVVDGVRLNVGSEFLRVVFVFV